MDWDEFKRTNFAVICNDSKEKFFSDCKENGIHIFLSDFARKRNLFVCAKRYENRVGGGRYELFALKGWETRENGLYGNTGIPELDYDLYTAHNLERSKYGSKKEAD